MDDNQMAQMRSLINRLGVRQGVLVAEVMPESPAQKAGMKQYDVIVSLGGREVANFTELQEALARHRPGDTVEVKYVRDKKIYTVNVTL
jgi:S1-C subfamily serine protease